MSLNKLNLLRLILFLGSLYYLIGAIAHWRGLTIFPFYDGRLYSPYHDSVIALTALVFALILLTVARDPLKNLAIFKVVIIGAILASVFSIAIIWKVDLAALGAPDKAVQTVVEGILGFVFAGALLWLYPRQIS